MFSKIPSVHNCGYCGEDLGEDCERTDWGYFHTKCVVAGVTVIEYQYHQDQLEYEQEQMKLWKKDIKLINRLRKRLPEKIMTDINYCIREHSASDYEIVNVDQCKGYKESGTDWIGFSSAIKYTYDNTSSCGYTETYGGDVYLYIGNHQYLKMFISG